MSEALQQALTLLAVGMTSVFVVLSLVVLSGRILIRISNRISPEKSNTIQSAVSGKTQQPGMIPNDQLAVFSALVDHITQGQGRIRSVKKADQPSQEHSNRS